MCRLPLLSAPLLMLACCGASPGQDQAKPLQRWAIVASSPVVESGLPDLLTVRLSREDAVELVERQQLDEAAGELQLTPLLAAANVQRRLQLGKTLGADALLVLSYVTHQEKRFLRAVVCDARLGVRLWEEEFSTHGAPLEELVANCAGLLPEVRQRFSQGIQRIIAVPPFLSDDFAHQFDYLQSRHRHVLTSALMTRTGVAVVEIEEARAILRELEVTLAPGLDRPITTIVQGKYRVGPPDDDRQRTIDIEIELISERDQRDLIKKSFRLGMVGHWLRESLSRRLAGDADGGGPTPRRGTLDAPTQQAILARRAHHFAELGDWERSTSLREAALVLGPNLVLQRALLVREFQFRLNRHVEANWTPAHNGRRLPAARRAAALEQVARDYIGALGHLEYLIRNRLIGRVDAACLLYQVAWYRRGGVGETRSWDTIKFDALQPACLAQRRFLEAVSADIKVLPPGRVLPQEISSPFYGMDYVLLTHAVSDVRFNDYDAPSLASLHLVLDRLTSSEAKTSQRVLGLMSRSFSAARQLDLAEYSRRQRQQQDAIAKATDDRARRDATLKLQVLTPQSVRPHYDKRHAEWLKFLHRLAGSRRDVVRFYGSWGLLLDAERAYRTPAAAYAAPIAARMADVETHFATLKQRGRIGAASQTYIEDRLDMIRNRTRPRSPLARSAPVVPRKAATTSVASEGEGRIRFVPIELTVNGDPPAAGAELRIRGMQACGPACDAYWTNDRLYVMEQPGELRELKLSAATASRTVFQGATWDGRYLWLHVHGLGIVAVSPDGQRLATFTASDSLPGYERGLKLVGLAPGKVLAVGSFGPQDRAWCAILRAGEDGMRSVNLFFEARYVRAGRPPGDVRREPRIAFRPEGATRMRRNDGREFVWVDRRGMPSPLQIDLETLEVSVRETYTGDDQVSTCIELGFRGRRFLRGGRLITANSGLALLPSSKLLVYHAGWIYRPGTVWMREHVETGSRERLHRTKLPGRFWHLYAGVSSHYGVVAYDRSEQMPALSRLEWIGE